jgi:hypothetical protein
MGVTDVLVLAAAAFSEESTERPDSQGRFLFHSLRHRFHVVFSLPDDLYPNPVPRGCERDEYNFPIDPPHPAAAIDHFFDFQRERTIHSLLTAETAENSESIIYKKYRPRLYPS